MIPLIRTVDLMRLQMQRKQLDSFKVKFRIPAQADVHLQTSLFAITQAATFPFDFG